MKLSVIVPVYNVDTELGRCVDSLVGQTFRETEIILIDDGSSDCSGSVCDTFAQRFESVTVIHKNNGGVSSARNRGLDCATGDLITFADSDDTIDSDMYETLLSYFDIDTDIVHCSYKRIQNGGVINIGNSGRVIVQNNTEALDFFLQGRYFTGSLCNKIFRREIFNGLRLNEDLIINEDVLLCFLLFCNSSGSKFIDICKYNYLVRTGSATNNVNVQRKLEDSLYVCRAMYEAVTDEGLRRAAYNRMASTEMHLYQWLLRTGSHGEKKEVRKRLRTYRRNYRQLSKRNRIVLAGLLYCPHFYPGLYYVYDKIRKPNWDVN